MKTLKFAIPTLLIAGFVFAQSVAPSGGSSTFTGTATLDGGPIAATSVRTDIVDAGSVWASHVRATSIDAGFMRSSNIETVTIDAGMMRSTYVETVAIDAGSLRIEGKQFDINVNDHLTTTAGGYVSSNGVGITFPSNDTYVSANGTGAYVLLRSAPSGGNTYFVSGDSYSYTSSGKSFGVGGVPSYRFHVAGTPVGNVVAGLVCSSCTSSDNVLYVNTGTVATGTITAALYTGTAAQAMGMTAYNQENATATSHSFLEAKVGGSSAGDPHILFTINGVANWTFGVDNSDSDKVKLSASSALGSNNIFSGTTAEFRVEASYSAVPTCSSDPPPAGDCDAAAEKGRMCLGGSDNRMYVCNGVTRAWDYEALND